MTLFDAPETGVRRVSLVRLCALIAQAAAAIGRLSVEGEVHRPQTGRTGRQWFTLRDRASQITVSIPASRRSRCRIVAGERVSVTGRLEWVNDWGQLQLVAEEVLPVGAGAIAAMIAEARRRLEVDGLLGRARHPVPLLPAAIGVVCGHEAAVRADIESVVAARFPGYPVLFWETTVSGPGAVDNVIAGIRELDARSDVEVIILARGGGDATALLPFSDEELCRAVCGARTPVVAAIGHDGDRPLVDEVADMRCGTPSLAASAVVPDRAALFARLDGALGAAAGVAGQRSLAAGAALDRVDRHRAAEAGLDRCSRRLEHAAAQLRLMHPARELERSERRLAAVDWRAPAVARLTAASREVDTVDWRGPAQARVVAASHLLTGLRDRAEALSPLRVLERGYAIVRRTADGVVVRSPGAVGTGDRVAITVAGGGLEAVVCGD